MAARGGRKGGVASGVPRVIEGGAGNASNQHQVENINKSQSIESENNEDLNISHEKKEVKKVKDDKKEEEKKEEKKEEEKKEEKKEEEAAGKVIKTIDINVGDLSYLAPAYYSKGNGVVIPSFGQLNVRKFLVQACGLSADNNITISNDELIPFIVAANIKNDKTTLEILDNVKEIRSTIDLAQHRIEAINTSMLDINERINTALESKIETLAELVNKIETREPTEEVEKFHTPPGNDEYKFTEKDEKDLEEKLNQIKRLGGLEDDIKTLKRGIEEARALQVQYSAESDGFQGEIRMLRKKIETLEEKFTVMDREFSKIYASFGDVSNGLSSLKKEVHMFNKTHEVSIESLNKLIANINDTVVKVADNLSIISRERRAERSGNKEIAEMKFMIDTMNKRLAALENPQQKKLIMPDMGAAFKQSYLTLARNTWGDASSEGN